VEVAGNNYLLKGSLYHSHGAATRFAMNRETK